MTVHVYGIRHHGPGSARSLLQSLHALKPDMVLIEGPPDAEEVIPLAQHPEMKPPVALVVYPSENPGSAWYYPFAAFSPEWQALRYAGEHKVPARFIDLPLTHRFALVEEELKALAEKAQAEAEKPETEDSEESEVPTEPTEALREDPIAMLAEAAGYADHELWWETQVERRKDPEGVFQGLIEAMGALREHSPEPKRVELQREAYMRTCIRQAEREGYTKIAVVCGAWHAPVLAERGPQKADTELLRGLPKTKVTATWIPWTNSRLSYRSGYGAGVESPGWYGHVWEHAEGAAIRWCTLSARLLREKDLDASSASVIEAVRLADALSAMRDLHVPGLTELREAIQAVLCNGSPEPMALVRTRLEVGEALGETPSDAPAVPLQRDLEAAQKKVRLKPSAEIQTLTFDLRKDTDRERSRLLHRLNVLGIEWGTPQEAASRGSGTFKEAWQVVWRPELSVALIEKNVFGHTIEKAATAYLISQSATAELDGLTSLLNDAVTAELPEAVQALIAHVQERAAVSGDVRKLMNALGPLAKLVRYSDVRETRVDLVAPVLHGLFERILVGLGPACAQLDEDAASEMAKGIDQVHDAITLLDEAERLEEWKRAIRRLMERDGVHGLIRGLCCKRLLDLKAIDDSELETALSLALNPRVDALQAASWVEGLLRGSSSVLLHQDSIWAALDGWLRELPKEMFEGCLPLLRRAFSSFAGPERRRMASKVKVLAAGGANRVRTESEPLDFARAALTMPVLTQLLGGPRGA